MIKQYYLNHSQIDVYFKQSKDDFVVTEIPLYEFTGEGEHVILKIRKKDLTTWDALEIIASKVGCRSRDIGYAGLKDKNAMTVQYISILKKFEDKIDTFEHPQIKILEKTYLYGEAIQLIDNLFENFLKTRLSSDWKQSVIPRIRGWIYA